MSDIAEYGTPLEHHTLEMLAAQWDGTDEGALSITESLGPEVVARGCTVFRANHVRDTRQAPEFWLGIRRRGDGKEWTIRLRKSDWLVLDLHRERIYDVRQLAPEEGDWDFRRAAPIISIAEGRNGITE